MRTMMMKRSTIMRNIQRLLVLALLCFQVTMASSAVPNKETNDEVRAPHYNQCESETLKSSPRKLVLSINAANGNVDWERVEGFAAGNNWEVKELVLDGFGKIMREESFHAALERSYPVLKSTLETTNPDVLLVSSKGVGVIAYLAWKNLWVERPVILLSPVPNPIEGLVDGSSFETEWIDTINIMRKRNLNPTIFAVGSSSDEEMLISLPLQGTSCGKVSQKTRSFENCKGWRHVVVKGDHSWKNRRENEQILARLIDFIIVRMDKVDQSTYT